MEHDLNITELASPSLLGVRGQGLTDREKWLMRRAWVEAWDVGAVQNPAWGMDDWLNEMAADGVTVEMVLAKDAPTPNLP